MDISELSSRLSSGRLFHAYIVTGADADTRMRAGKLIAQAAVCQAERGVPCGVCRDCVKCRRDIHPDIEIVRREKENANHTVDAMRALRARAAVLPNEAKRGVHIIDDADFMNMQAQNAMLKVLEEPPEHAVFILLADNPQRLLETVRSRCETVSLNPEQTLLDPKVEAVARELMEAYVRRDNLGLVRAAQPVEKFIKTELFDLMTALRRETLGRSGTLSETDVERFMEAADSGDKLINANIRGGYVAGELIAELIDRETASR